jgi:ectoine hydroxylase-related dioxygenase (phytanoyl-CoA dioxygenase family)
LLEKLRSSVFMAGEAGTRCLLDIPEVAHTAIMLKQSLIQAQVLPDQAVAIQAIAFDKTEVKNWKVTWHQDVMFPFARPVTSPGFELSSRKGGVDYARPPAAVLEQMLAVRLHLDDCDATNGPLRVSPGSHQSGILRATDIHEQVAKRGEVECHAQEGVALLMKPLLLHASSPAKVPKHRRVLHIVFHSGEPIPESWHRAI